MGCGEPRKVAGLHQNLIKLGFEETTQRNIGSLERGEDGGCEAKVPECWPAAESGSKVMGRRPRWYSGKGEEPELSCNPFSTESKSLESGH